jgi:hypothetical protein
LPRTLHLQALPAMDLRVASNFASFGAPSVNGLSTMAGATAS